MNDCIEWTGAFNTSGYPVDNHKIPREKYGTQYAHRQAWIERFGPIPKGLQIDHLCGNPPCVNTNHMQLLTPQAHGAKSSARLALGALCRNSAHEIGQADIENGTCIECRRATNRDHEARRRAAMKIKYPTLRDRGLCRNGLHLLAEVGVMEKGNRCIPCRKASQDAGNERLAQRRREARLARKAEL